MAKQERRKKGYSLVREETSYSPILFAGSKVDIQVDFHHNFNADKVHSFFFLYKNVFFFRPRLNILIFLQILG